MYVGLSIFQGIYAVTRHPKILRQPTDDFECRLLAGLVGGFCFPSVAGNWRTLEPLIHAHSWGVQGIPLP